MKTKLVIFDLDGVLINSKINMKYSWEYIRKKHNLKITFKDYFKFIGRPFKDILVKLKIQKRLQDKIYKDYNSFSRKNLNLIKLYPNTLQTLEYLKKNKIGLAIVTSKNKTRSVEIVKKFKIPIKLILSPSNKVNGKPSPDLLKIALKKLSVSSNESFYIGDMYVDYKAARGANINFIFCKYGYSSVKNCYKNKINKISDLIKIIDER